LRSEIRINHPGSRGQKGTGSWIRIRNTEIFATQKGVFKFEKDFSQNKKVFKAKGFVF
jgi:hypothetical protein